MKAIRFIIDSDWVGCPYCGKRFEGLKLRCPQCRRALRWNIVWLGAVVALLVGVVLYYYPR